MKNTSRKYKGGKNEEEGKGGWFGFFDSKPEDGASAKTPTDGENPFTKMMATATGAAQKVTGFGKNPGSNIKEQLAELEKKHNQDLADAAANYKKRSEAIGEDEKQIEAELQAANTKIKEDYIKEKGELQKDIDREIDDAKKTLAALSESAPGSAQGSAPGSATGIGGGRRRRSGARRSGARRSGARNGRSGARRSGARNGNGKSKSKGKKRITRKKGRNNKKRTRRYKKH